MGLQQSGQTIDVRPGKAKVLAQLARKGAKPTALIEMAKSLHGAERAVRNALEIVL
jgi:hypothetical protein